MSQPDFSPTADIENKDPLKSPLLYFVIGILLLIALFNFFGGKSSTQIEEGQIVEIIDAYITNNPEKLATANIEAIVRDYVEQHGDEIRAKLSEAPQKKTIDAMMANYIMENPGTLIASVEKWQSQQVLQKRIEAKEKIFQKQQELHHDASTPWIGNPDADIHVVEFFDYNCGYCKKVLPTINELIKSDANIKISFKEYPILNADSEKASRAALAVHKIAPEKYFDYHKLLMGGSSRNEASILQAASSLDIDVDKMKAIMDSSAISDILGRNRSLATNLTISGTPAFVIGTTLVPGAASLQDMQSTIAKERAKK